MQATKQTEGAQIQCVEKTCHCHNDNAVFSKGTAESGEN